MARGWESKGVEDQQSEFTNSSRPAKQQLSVEERERATEQQRLLMARNNVLGQLKTAQNPRYVEMLKRALVDLERRLQLLDGGQKPGVDL